MQSKQFVDLQNARTDEQRRVMDQIKRAEHCPFCLENLHTYHKQPTLRQTSHWILTRNQWPYAHTKLHLLAIYKQHAEQLQDMAPEAGRQLIELFQWAEEEFAVPGGGFALRFGDTQHSAGTVLHLHAQFLVPDLNSRDFEPVRIKIGASK